ncbi:MAG: LiaI-LiaF-like domain-containing protein [bacterium]
MDRQKKSVENSAPYCYCVRARVHGWKGISFCGVALIAVGVLWLLGNLHVISHGWWRYLLPLLLIGWGMLHLFSVRKSDV